MRNLATERQIQAANPDFSTWLSANAGSGKTRVLTDRVARLLLNGVPPQNILCLTYTKAAASEMQNRLFKRLGAWAMKPDRALAADLSELGVADFNDLNQARRLFAGALETPGGLKIQTIHSFCAAILRRFPLEAGVTPHFTEMDDRAARILREEVTEHIATGPDAGVLAGLARFYSGDDLSSLTARICDNRASFTEQVSARDVWSWFGLADGFDEGDVLDKAIAPGDGALIGQLSAILATLEGNDAKAGAALAAIDPDNIGIADLDLLESVFLFGAKAQRPFGAKIGSFPNKATREGPAAHLMPELEALMVRIEGARDLKNSLYSAKKALALHRFARPFLLEYERRKLYRGWVDFDDLIQKAATLLADPSVAEWVLYRLDGFIDHILVDEAQDTSPGQWQVIEHLAREFTTGDSARPGVHRTLFVVGDPKQSIYSFQGAEPAAFTHMKTAFEDRLRQVGDQLNNLMLEHSFRSSAAVLELVDLSLRDLPGLDADALHHIAFQEAKPGRVDLWPDIETTGFDDDRHWTDTSDIPQPENAATILASNIADDIQRMLISESIQAEIEENGVKKTIWRRVEPGDILILVRGRKDGLFDELIRACKAANLAIAGADQLRIGAELAVKDLVALLRFLTTPEDDLSLAAALRSPLFNWSESDLFALAHPRPENNFLWAALRKDGRHGATVEMLQELLRRADYLRPYDLIEHILTRHSGRARLLARLGAEAEDGIDALLFQALNYERLETPSLTGFLEWLDADEVTVKRQMDSAGNQIRVMTVHGAKGLEAPIVILPDTRMPRSPRLPELARLDNSGNVIWRPTTAQMPSMLTTLNEEQRQAAFEEWIRLLYVAMTRAGQWLIVAAAGKVGTGDQSWYSIVREGMERAQATPADFPTGRGLRYQTGKWQVAENEQSGSGTGASPLPEWATRPPPAPMPELKTLSPSGLGGDKALPGESGQESEAAMQRGRQIHRLLELLPQYAQSTWQDIAVAALSTGADAATSQAAAELALEVTALLDKPEIARFFEPGTLAEVEVSADIGGARLHGVIDRLVVGPDHIVVVDFKTNEVVPTDPADTPDGILRQMAAYRAAIGTIYPGKRIDSVVLWTRPAVLMPIPDMLLDAALSRLDGAVAAT